MCSGLWAASKWRFLMQERQCSQLRGLTERISREFQVCKPLCERGKEYVHTESYPQYKAMYYPHSN